MTVRRRGGEGAGEEGRRGGRQAPGGESLLFAESTASQYDHGFLLGVTLTTGRSTALSHHLDILRGIAGAGAGGRCRPGRGAATAGVRDGRV